MRHARLVLLGGALAALLGGCRSEPDPPAPAAPSVDRSTDPLLERVRTIAVAGAKRTATAFAAVEAVSQRGDREAAWQAYLELRRQYRRMEPIAPLFAPLSSSQIDPPLDEADEGPSQHGLRVLGDALLADPVDWGVVRRALSGMRGPVRLLASELESAPLRRRHVASAVSMAIFEWGRRLDGSAAAHQAELRADVMDGARGVLDYALLYRDAVREHDSEAAAAFDAPVAALGRWLEGDHSRKLDALRYSGKLGAALRRAVVGLGLEPVRPPFVQRYKTHDSPDLEPVSVASFPALLGAPPQPERAALGAELFFDSRLSAAGRSSCASCHALDKALSAGALRPLAADGKPVPRDVPGLFNVAYEPMHFWDGRASTLARQVEIAVERDMGGSWPKIVERLRKDQELARRFGVAFDGGLSADTVREALEEFERTLITAETPFDRYVRGETDAMSKPMHGGFDVFFGKAHCSRCHRLPLTSGAIAPRFVDGELSVIGVPRRPGTAEVDPDEGRGGLTGHARDRHAFKVPGLRNLAVTAPYFHNGAFRSLEAVVDFYAEGSGAGLGMTLEGFDADAGPFQLSARERAELVVFLRDGLRDPVAVPR